MPAVPTQEPEGPPPPARTFSNLALPISGVPLIFESIEERITKLRDGASKREVETAKTYRDAAGRMRIESNLDFGGGSAVAIQIFDYTGGFMAVLDTGSKIAHRVTMPKQEQPGGQPRFMFISPLVALPGEKTHNTQSLGTQTMEGHEFEGRRATTTMDGEPSVVDIQEHWVSQELGLIGLMSSSSPDEESTVRIQRLDRKEPDPGLFVIPSDYSVVNLEWPVRDV